MKVVTSQISNTANVQVGCIEYFWQRILYKSLFTN